MSKIKRIYGEEILDSRGNPTVQATVVLSDGIVSKSSVPAGASKGLYEAYELRDQDLKRYQGLGVLNAVNNINDIISQKISGFDVFEQREIDKAMIELDGTQNKSKLGANAILPVSQAVARAAAKSSLLPLSLYLRGLLTNKEFEKKMPTPLFNILEGGKHADRGPDFQEFLIIPATFKKYKEALDIGVAAYQSLRSLLIEKGSSVLNADEGGFAPQVASNVEALNMLKLAIDRTGYKFAYEVFMGLDVAANSFKDKNDYKLKDKSSAFSPDELVEYYKNIFVDYSLIYIEDPFGEDDWESWKKIYQSLGGKTMIVGDDLVTTNPYRLQLALENNAINSLIVKPNQVGTITESLVVIEIARYKKLKIIVSHRSGETSDDFIADFAVAVGADYVKFGAPARERMIKYNRLSEIEKEIQIF
ncbi:phosphopyruvate hydratase [Candidatus Parcubacteria bacterium]|nr:MAG: phosphopyruvate hydratase [Candidatus Parcubacteria bacterium]